MERQRPCGIKDPRLRKGVVRTLGTLLDLTLSSAMRIEVRGRENFSRLPSTLAVANHRRDSDGPIISAVIGRRSRISRGALPHIVAREDLFRRGFLREYFTGLPAPIRESFSPLCLRSFFWTMQLYPLFRVPERTLWEVLEDVLRYGGDLPLDEVLKPHYVEKFTRLAANGQRLSVRQALKKPFRLLLRERRGLARLTLPQFRALKPFMRALIQSQLELVAQALEQGETVLLKPEGMVSADGRFSRIRDGLHLLITRPKATIRVLPIGISYDFMTAGRQTVFVNIGDELSQLKDLSRKEIDVRVKKAILEQVTVTASHLASCLVLLLRRQGSRMVTASQLIDYVGSEAVRYHGEGRYVDPKLLKDETLAKRMAAYMDYCRRSGTLRSLGSGRFEIRSGIENSCPSWLTPEGMFNYLHNELIAISRIKPHFGEYSIYSMMN